MITEYMITMVYNVILFAVNLLAFAPDVSLSVDLTGALSSISPYYQAMDTIVPMGTFTAILTFELLFIGGFFGYKMIRWGYKKIPFVN